MTGHHTQPKPLPAYITPGTTRDPRTEHEAQEGLRLSAIQQQIERARAIAHPDNDDDFIIETLLFGFRREAQMLGNFSPVISETAALTAFHDALRHEFAEDTLNSHLPPTDTAAAATSQTGTRP